MPDQVHMCIAIPPKHPVASVIGSLKGKVQSPLPGCAARSGIYLASISEPAATPCPPSTLNWNQVRQYIREQETADGANGQF
jgi:REP element-mobilizing transposase RayT